MSDPKELMFFLDSGLDRSDFQNYLVDNFSKATNETWLGEGSTVYFQWPGAMENIVNFLGPELKIIISLRHPVEKAVSFYIHNWRRGRFRGSEPILDVGYAQATMSPRYTSLYSSHISRWQEAFGKERIAFLLFDTLLEDSACFVKGATDFLGVAPLKEVIPGKVNPGPRLKLEGDHLVVQGTPKPGQVVPKIEISDIKEMQKLFLNDIRATEELIGQDLAKWRKMPFSPK
jgi:hypothetical protein